MSERAGWQTSEHGGEKLLQTNSLCARLMLSSPRRERCVWLLASFYVLHPKQYVLACAPTMYQQMRAEFIKRSFEFYLLRDARDEIMGKWVETFLVYSTQLSSLSDCLIQVVAPYTLPARASVDFPHFPTPSNSDWSSICRYFVSVAFILVHIFHNVLWLRSSRKHMKLICKQMVAIRGWRHETESSAD